MAGHGGPLPVPVPALVPASLATLSADADADPFSGGRSPLAAAFLHDIHNAANNTTTADIKANLADAGTQHHPIFLAISHSGVARIYSFLMKWSPGFANREPHLSGLWFAAEGDLVDERAYVVEIPDTVFSLVAGNTTVPLPALVATTLAAANAGAPVGIMGPYASGDADTVDVRSRKVAPVPHSVAGLMLLHPEGVTWQVYFRQVYPAIEAEGADAVADAAPLTILMQQLTVANPSAACVADRPRPPARSVPLLKAFRRKLAAHFPHLAEGGANAIPNAISQGIGVLAQQHRLQIEREEKRREDKKANAVGEMFGPMLNAVLCMTQTANQADLVAECPIYAQLAAAKKADRRNILDQAIKFLQI